MRLALCLLMFASPGCERRPPTATAPSAPELPWQPHGFRAPTLSCEITVPAGLKRNTPMPDHLVELMSDELPPKVIIIVSERVEESLPAAVARVRAFHQPKDVLEEPLDGGALLTVRPQKDQVESVALLASPGMPLVEAVGRFSDESGKAKLLEVVNSLRCARKQGLSP